MPTKRTRRARIRRPPLQPWQFAWLDGQDLPDTEDNADFYFWDKAEMAELWAAYGEPVTANHVAEYPGTRPERWWKYSAPEPRLRLGGVGSARFEAFGQPSLTNGVPDRWLLDESHRIKILDRDGVVLDPADPPTFESEAAYLDRLDLFFPGERAALTEDDFEPEEIVPPAREG